MDTEATDQGKNVKSQKLAWSEDMSTGFPDIDAQHMEWIARFNQFNDAIVEGKGVEAWTNNLLFFVRYTETHFRFEEDIMQQYHYSGKAPHIELHARFRSRIEEIMNMTWPEAPILKDMQLLQSELSNWLQNHICKVDVQLREIDKSFPSKYTPWGNK